MLHGARIISCAFTNFCCRYHRINDYIEIRLRCHVAPRVVLRRRSDCPHPNNTNEFHWYSNHTGTVPGTTCTGTREVLRQRPPGSTQRSPIPTRSRPTPRRNRWHHRWWWDPRLVHSDYLYSVANAQWSISNTIFGQEG